MKIVLNAIIAKRNGGGATQIVYNYLKATLSDADIEWYYIVSEEFVEFIREDVGVDSDHWLVLPRQPQVRTYFKAKKSISHFLDTIRPDLVYSILAPSYFGFKYTEVMRCCNAWDVIDSNDEAFSFIDKKTRRRFRLKTWLVRRLMKRADYFITQTQVAKDGIAKVTGKEKERIAVVPNVLPLFFQSITPRIIETEGINILYVASPSPHKNLTIIPQVAKILKEEYKVDNFKFLVTIPSKVAGVSAQILEEAKSLNVEETILNVGGKSQKDLVELYESATIGFFPSVLETFSATLLEYMYFNLPIVSSDKPFNKEVIGDAALYFEATNAKEAASAIFQIISNVSLKESLIIKTKEQIKSYLDYKQHYISTTEFFKKIVNEENNKY